MNNNDTAPAEYLDPEEDPAYDNIPQPDNDAAYERYLENRGEEEVR